MHRLIAILGPLAIVQGLWLAGADGLAAWALATGGAGRAVAAARIGLVRGDLWGEAARLEPPPSRASRDHAGDALALAPLQSDLWLLLAEDAGTPVPSSMAALQMAFLTGGGRVGDIPARLLAAARFPGLAHSDLEPLVTLDVTRVLRDLPDLRPALSRAYAQALADNRVVFEGAARLADPAFRF